MRYGDYDENGLRVLPAVAINAVVVTAFNSRLVLWISFRPCLVVINYWVCFIRDIADVGRARWW